MRSNAIFVTCVYDRITWQGMSLSLYKKYCDNIGCDLVVIDKYNKHIKRLVLPRDDTNFLKIGTIMEAADSKYDKVVFADIDILVNPNYRNIFDDIDNDSIYIHGSINNRVDTEEWTKAKKGGCNIIWPYYKFCYADNFLGRKKKTGITSWNTCHSMNPQWCEQFVDFLSTYRLLPINRENANHISDLCTIDGRQDFMTDEILMELFVDRHLSSFKKITWPHNSHFEINIGSDFSEFMIDFWNISDKNMLEKMNPWYKKILLSA